ncbi:NAD(P)-dependent oxidoreductase [Bosea sp. (in: a-proteobacteria)]|uniref:NAD(P)-dependent oxidoreductase n=1 Tax=Bosea sp. (in: a-proteobacteria) TaxID=1871050 RepID=UPI00261DCCE2|nr:NAD(P)-dependent oxidoreductase [Bosea sp. (in: a-proteobacteria)]MCO5092936.1 NAD(P)-dependent oxidoreductase [Bosea sp. (in: a-proteobacteria)]
MAQTFGFVGLGRMGSRMAGRLVAAGHAVVGYDPAAPAGQHGLRRAGSLAQLGEMAETVLLSLPDAAVVDDVLFAPDGLLSGSSRVRTVIDLSTIGPKAATATAAALAQRGVGWVEAPVSGGPRGAEGGTLAVMVSCTDALYAEAEPVLAPLGRIFRTGTRPGLAQAAKLANNMLSTTALVITAEAMTMGVKAGLDPAILLDIINAGSGRNSATQDKFPRAVVTRGFDYGFATALAYKDARLCVDEAENLGVPMLLGSLVRQMMAATNAKFGPASDFTEVARIYEEWAGVEIGAGPSA